MSFYDVQQGDVPYLKFLADHYTLSDNYHQPVWGGTMVQHLLLGYADLIWYSDGSGHPVVPPADQIEDPNPQAGTNNYYTNDGGGAVYTDCSDTANPGVEPIVAYLTSLPRPIDSRCESGRFYPLNNQSPRFQRGWHPEHQCQDGAAQHRAPHRRRPEREARRVGVLRRTLGPRGSAPTQRLLQHL